MPTIRHAAQRLAGTRTALLIAMLTAISSVAPNLSATTAELASTEATVELLVTNVRNSSGVVRAALCGQAEFLGKRCRFEVAVPAQAGTVRLTLTPVPPGRYAIQAWHDEKSSNTIDRDLLGIPLEGVGFSNDPRLLLGPPSFKEAAFSVTPSKTETTLRLRYFR